MRLEAYPNIAKTEFLESLESYNRAIIPNAYICMAFRVNAISCKKR